MAQNKPLIKVGFLVSYDYDFIKNSLPIVYPHADQITFAIDKDRKTWNGEEFDIPDTFFEWVKEYDKENKIRIYEDVFHIPTLSTMECDTRERNLLADYMGDGGWHLQIDSDEYFLDFKGFTDYLRTLDIRKETQVFARWITMYKKNGNDIFLIDTNEVFPVAANHPKYKLARLSESTNDVYTDFHVVHQSWAREDEEIKLKIRNWGHNKDFDANAYFAFWRAINKQTYRYARSFHPLDPWLWPSLEYFETKNIDELVTKVKAFLKEKEEEKKISEKIKVKDFIPPVLYKIKTLLKK